MGTRVRKIQLLKHPNNRSPFWYVRYWELKLDGRTWREVWRSAKTTVKKDAETNGTSMPISRSAKSLS
jgi:hypothetical protein